MKALARHMAATVHRNPGQWRDVLSELTPARLRQIIRGVASGERLEDYLELAQQLEERDLHYRSVVQQRRLAVGNAPAEVRPAEPTEQARAIADDVQRLVDNGIWHNMTLDLLDGLGKGFSAVEVVWERTPRGIAPAAYEHIDPRWVAFDRTDGRTPLLRDWNGQIARGLAGQRRPASMGVGGIAAYPIPPGKAIVHVPRLKSGLPARGGIAYAVCALTLLKSVALRDWWAYAEIFGLPVRVGRHPRDAQDEDIDTLTQALMNLASDAGCVLPEGMEIEFPTVQTGGQRNELFERMARWCDEQISKAVVGVTMTSDAGSSRAQADVHLAVREDLIQDDQRQLLDTLNHQIVRWYVDARHGPQAEYPRLARPQEETIDIDAVDRAVRMGLPVPMAWVYERMGIPEPTAEQAVLTGRAPGEGAASDGGDGTPGRGGELTAMLDAARALSLSGTSRSKDWAALALRHGALLGLTDDVDGAPAGDEWAALAERYAAPIRAALASTDTPEAFVEAALEAGVDMAAVEDLALRDFKARVDGGTDGD